MIDCVQHTNTQPDRYDVSRYFALAEAGLIAPDERTELLDGVIVAMAPQSPLHAGALGYVEKALREAFPTGTLIRTQLPFVVGDSSVPEPDVAVVPGGLRDYLDRHPTTAHLIVEITVTTVAQDRLTKSRIYAAAGVPNYWIVHPGQEWVEVYREPHREARVYRRCDTFDAGAILELDGVPGVRVASKELLPRLTSA